MKASDQIRAHLEEAISRGELLPGEAIDELALAERFGVSRTPVREALIQLQAQGWVSNLPRGGPIVAKMDLQQLLSLWELLAELEAVAIRLACERMGDDEIQDLVALHELSREVVARDQLNASFEQHHALVDALQARNAEGPAARMRDHMRPGRDARTLNDFVVNLPADLLAST